MAKYLNQTPDEWMSVLAFHVLAIFILISYEVSELSFFLSTIQASLKLEHYAREWEFWNFDKIKKKNTKKKKLKKKTTKKIQKLLAEFLFK